MYVKHFLLLGLLLAMAQVSFDATRAALLLHLLPQLEGIIDHAAEVALLEVLYHNLIPRCRALRESGESLHSFFWRERPGGKCLLLSRARPGSGQVQRQRR